MSVGDKDLECRASVRSGVGTPLRYAPTHCAHSATRLKPGKLKNADPEKELAEAGKRSPPLGGPAETIDFLSQPSVSASHEDWKGEKKIPG